MRPILDRIHYAVNHLVNARENNATQHNTGVDDKNSSITPNSTQPISMMTHVHITPEPAYGLVEFIQEMRDASQGSAVPVLQHLSLQDAMPGEDKGNTQGEKGRKEKGKEEKRKEEQQQQRDMRRIALVGHSASGWVGRLYLGMEVVYHAVVAMMVVVVMVVMVVMGLLVAVGGHTSYHMLIGHNYPQHLLTLSVCNHMHCHHTHALQGATNHMRAAYTQEHHVCTRCACWEHLNTHRMALHHATWIS